MNFEAISVWLRNTLLPYGGMGLMVLAMCDSSFVSLPEVNDVLLMTFAVNEPESMVKFALLTTLGSVIGCALLYAAGRKGGDAFLRRSFADERLMKIQRWYQRHGVRSEEHTSELQSHLNLVCRLLLEKKNTTTKYTIP